MAHNLQHSLLGVQLAGRALTQLADGGGGDGAAAGAAGAARGASIGFAAVKLSSFARPELLQRVSGVISGHERAFAALAGAANSPRPGAAAGATAADELPPGAAVSRPAFVRLLVSRSAASGGTPALSEEAALRVFDAVDHSGDGVIDELDFADAAALLALAPESEARELEAAAGLSGAGRGSLASHLGINAESLDASARAEWAAVVAHTCELATAAADGGVSVMVDAEQSYLQPAIEAATLAAQRRFNRPRSETVTWIEPALAHARVLAAGGAGRPAAAAAGAFPALRRQAGADSCYPAIYTTVQAYLVEAPARLLRLRRRAQRERFLYGVKLVRGAYMVQEQHRAEEMGYADPIHASQDATHACYDSCAADLAHAALAGRAEFMAATHNERSVVRLLDVMRARGVESPAQARGVSFGQLLGMCDHVSLSLGAVGYPAFKYVPYGPVLEVVPYLIRRAQENSSLLAGGVAKEIRLLQSEIARRASRGFAR
jgi:proline dehydrogenase